MGLSSQSRRDVIGIRSARPMGGRRRRRRQRTLRRAVPVAMIAFTALAGWWFFLRPSAPDVVETAEAAPVVTEPSGEPSGTELAAAGDLPADTEQNPGTIAATPERDPAALIRMGQPVTPPERTNTSERTDFGAQIQQAARQAAEDSVPDEGADAPVLPVFSSPDAVREKIMHGYAALEQNRPVDARRLLTDALLDPGCTPADQSSLRRELTLIADRLTFSPTIAGNDPTVTKYVVSSGDALSRIPRSVGAEVDWRFIQRINQISDPRRIRVGQTLKIVRGPFHAVVDKSEYRMDVYAEIPTSEGGGVVYIRSFPVGLGELDSTPTGEWVVRESSKLVNPNWTNPRTGERFSADDPMNPIGERWIGLRGTDATTEALAGYGIHGTVEPDSIGQQRSMGCVRLGDEDVELIYEMLVEGVSRVAIVE